MPCYSPRPHREPTRAATAYAGPSLTTSTHPDGSRSLDGRFFEQRFGNAGQLEIMKGRLAWNNGEGPGTWSGIQGELDGLRYESPEELPVGISAGAGHAGVDISGGEDGATWEAGLTGPWVEGRLGDFSADRNADSQVKVGFSEGVGIGGGLHWGDEDHDGQREYGFKGDIELGPGFSLDVKTEDPLAMLAPIVPLTNSILQHNGKEGINVTDTVIEGIGNLNDWLFGEEEEKATGMTGMGDAGSKLGKEPEVTQQQTLEPNVRGDAGTHLDTRTSPAPKTKGDPVWDKYIGGFGGQPVVKLAPLGTDGPGGSMVMVIVYADGSAVFLGSPDAKKGGSSTLLRQVPKGSVPLDKLDQLSETYGVF